MKKLNKMKDLFERSIKELKIMKKVSEKTNLIVNNEKSFVNKEIVKNLREVIEKNTETTVQLKQEIDILKKEIPLILKDTSIAKKYIEEAGKEGLDKTTILKVKAGFEQILYTKEVALKSLENKIFSLNKKLEKEYIALMKGIQKEKENFKNKAKKYKEENSVETIFDLASSIIEDKKSYTIIPTAQNKQKKQILDRINELLNEFTEKIQIFTMDHNSIEELKSFRKKTNIEGGVTTLIKEEMCISMKYQKGKLRVVLMSVVDKKLMELGYQTPISTLKKYKNLLEATK